MVELFIYWRVLDADVAAALAATAEFQAQQRAQHAGLRTGLYRRGGSAGQTTLLETYAMPARGIDPGLQKSLTEAAAQALQHWAQGDRHLEAFDVVQDLLR